MDTWGLTITAYQGPYGKPFKGPDPKPTKKPKGGKKK